MTFREAPHLLDATMFWNPGGGVRRYITAKRQWGDRHVQWRHTVATPTPDGPEMVRVPSWPLPGSHGSYRLPVDRAAAADALRAARPDLIESADPYRLAWSALDAAATLGIPSVAFCHSNLERMAGLLAGARWRAPAERMARRYARHLYRRFDLVLAPSRAMTAHLRDWGVDAAVHQPLGVDTRVFSPERHDPAWRRSLELPPDARLLVFTGRFAPEKDLPTLVEATRLLGPPHWLIAIGAGPRPPSGERVRVLPLARETAELARMLASADLFVHAGAQETFGLAALEALACGTPVVACAAEGMGELIDDDVGHAVARPDPTEFAAAIASALARDRQALGAAARRRALEHDWGLALAPLWRRYRTLLGLAHDLPAHAA